MSGLTQLYEGRPAVMEKGLFNIFYEAELMFFDDEFCACLRDLLNDKLAKYLVAFVRETEQEPMIEAARVGLEKIKLLVLPYANNILLAEKLKSWPITWLTGLTAYDLLNQIVLSDAIIYSNSKDRRNEVLSIFNYILGLEGQLISYIDPREKKAAADFLKLVCGIEHNLMILTAKMGSMPLKHNSNLVGTVKANMPLFYAPSEAARKTGLNYIIGKLNDIKMMREGLIYNQLCDDLHLTEAQRSAI